ncbi:hypothetical protein TRAPUB_8015 [Trametes pubescens]|uniref:Uncharacterized protein n=1 Tax=Trametes pubescens TaxID=154538 RepID=A0A1M2W6E7_TRAPU|nr:hypothetical protein TRAPUB_8015 [Trametes pubescens]
MSTNSESWIPTYDIAEELVNNAVDDVPFAKDIWIISNKCFSIRKLRGTLKDGREKLHEGGELLCRPDVQAALEGRQMYKDLCDTYFELEAVAQNLEQQIDGLKFYQFKKKYTIHVNAAHWKADSYRYMVTVRERLCKDVINSSLDAPLPGTV